MICPVLLSMIFLLPQWWIFEKETSIRNRIWTFLLVLILFWPQWKMLQILYMGLFKKDPDWKKEKEKLIRNIGCLGKTESCKLLLKNNAYYLKVNYLSIYTMYDLSRTCFGKLTSSAYHFVSMGPESSTN